MTTINQKEYLKKYLGIGKAPGDKKRKKKKEKTLGNRLKIIDDDADLLMSHEIQDDISAANEDAPQIVAVIDERPPSLRIDEETKSKLWKPIGEVSDPAGESKTFQSSTSFKLNKQIKNSVAQNDSSRSIYKRKNDSEILSRTKIKKEAELSPKRDRSDDMSPPRVQRGIDTEKNSSRLGDMELESASRKRKSREVSDLSSPENCTRGKDEDNSPPRRKDINDSDFSPPRRRHKDNSPVKKNKDDDVISLKKDNSPPSRIKIEKDNSPPRRRNLDDISPPRRRNHEDVSAKKKSREEYSKQKSSRWGDWGPESSPPTPSKSDKKMDKTLDGKKAGLQNAKDLVREVATLKEKEDRMFKNLSAEVSGKNATTVVREKKVSDPEADASQLKKEKETKEKYDRWGKGLKQVEDQSEKMAEQLHEMSKPLARYADDEDLEKYLKEQEREGDPMLAYIRKKKKKQSVATGIPEKPMYMGEFMPNRFGICPGYRWDGVDRSNDYEKKWFQVQNSRKATQEEAFKWSTEDM